MNAKTLKALNGSIRKWDKIINRKGDDDGTDNCPLCIEFYRGCNCRGCPVFKKTKKYGCQNSPYEDWCDHGQDHYNNYPKKVKCKTCKTLAQKELAFLKSLKPKRRMK